MDTPPAERHPDLSRTAVALKGDGQEALLIAKGRGALAEQMLDLAFANGVKVREDAALAQLLDTFDLDCLIPAEAMTAVAAVLAHVYAATADRAPA